MKLKKFLISSIVLLVSVLLLYYVHSVLNRSYNLVDSKIIPSTFLYATSNESSLSENNEVNISNSAKICMPRDYSFGSIVCVCNSTYCDTIPAINVPPRGKYIIFTSTSDGLRFEKTEGDFNLSNSTSSGSIHHINKSVTYQEIYGFGGAFTDSSGINILSLSPPAQEFLLKSYFSSEGIEYTMGRVPIGGTDFSARGYTYHDNITDANLGSFNLTEEDFMYKIPLIKRAQSMATKELKLVASCWSPPAWMKTTSHLGYGYLRREYYRAYANYHVKFLDSYKKYGIEFWCVTTGNEPAEGTMFGYAVNSLGWLPTSQTVWIAEDFGPVMRASHPNTCIIAVDDQRTFLTVWLATIMINKEASKYINGSAVHWYADSLVPSFVSLTLTHQLYPNIFILYTESSCLGFFDSKVILGSWSRGEEYARTIIDAIDHWATGWIDWNLVLDEIGGPSWVDNFVEAAIIVNKTADEFYKQPIFYVLGHFSKFIPPGSLVLKGTSEGSFNVIQTLAVKRPDNSVAVVLFNDKPFDVVHTFIDDDRGMVRLKLPKHSISSMVYR